MVQSKKIYAILLLAVMFVGTCESYGLCFYYDSFGHIITLPCPIYLRSPAGGGNSKDCTKDNPCPYNESEHES